MKPFLVCVHDATPAYDRETREIIRDLSPLIGRRLSFGVVPNWHGDWSLAAHPEYCELLRENGDELLLHGYFHRRHRGWGPASLLAERCDEMNGLDFIETGRTLARGQSVLVEVFGEPARGFIAPGWQRGNLRLEGRNSWGLDHVVGFFSLESARKKIPLSTWTWDCGRLAFLGQVGHVIGSLSHAMNRGVPILAIHPRDIERGFWPDILALIGKLLESGHEPETAGSLLKDAEC